jgi:hypothetical protein
MQRARRPISSRILVGAVCLLLASACSGGGSGGEPAPPGAPSCEAAQAFDSTFDAIQTVIFEKHGCTQDICHGEARSGELDLRPGAAYDAIFDVPSTVSALRLCPRTSRP